MKTLYLECNMGAAGDMLTAALLELLPDPRAFVERLNALGLPGVRYRAEPMEKCGIKCTHMTVTVHGAEEESLDAGHEHRHGYDHDENSHHHDHGHAHDHEHDHEHGHDHDHGESGHHHHSHSSLGDIEHIVSHLNIPEAVRTDVLAVYSLIAEAEGHVHGKRPEEIHFHEVGTLDAVADVTAVSLLLHELAPERIVASPVHVGSGSVRCAHGVLPVPAPATAYLLREIPSYGGDVQGELCTPTGAALLRHFADAFEAQPVMRVEKIGYGCGKKDFERANCVRAMLGTASEERERVLELRCNLDDMTPEAIGFAMERLFSAGALDVYTVPAGMKKDRPGTLLTCVCGEDRREELLRQLFLHTTTLGVRESVCGRYTLRRDTEVVETAFGPVHFKKAAGWGVVREKAEYEDLARVARAEGISLTQAFERVMELKRDRNADPERSAGRDSRS